MGRKLIVEVVGAKDLVPKDGTGMSSPYVVVDFDGQKKKTKTILRDLDPVWNDTLVFDVSDPKTMPTEILEAEVYNDRKTGGARRNHFLGRVRIGGNQFVQKGEEALIYFPLEKRHFFNFVKGYLGLKIYFTDADDNPPPPPEPAPEPEPESEQQPEAPQEEAKPPEEESAPPEEAKPPEEETPPQAETPPTDEAAPPPDAPPEEAKPPEDAPPAEESAPPPPEENPPPQDNSGGEEKPAEEAPPASDSPGNEAQPPPPEEQQQQQQSEAPVEEVKPADSSASEAPRSMADYLTRQINEAHSVNEQPSKYDLVQKMQYLFVKIVKARDLSMRNADSPADPYVKIRVGAEQVKTRVVPKSVSPEWNESFAFSKDKTQSAPTLEISVWDNDTGTREDFLGGVCFDLSEVPVRISPDSPLAPQWYRLDGDGRVTGDIMLAVWIGTQADEAFADAAGPDAGGFIHTRAKVYLSPKLWYLRVSVLDAQDLRFSPDKTRGPDLRVRIQLGMQVLRTRPSMNRMGTSPCWNEDMIFVAAEPFEKFLIITIEERSTKEVEEVGKCRIPLKTIERRVDDRVVGTRWFDLDRPDAEDNHYRGRIHLRLCFDGGYHVMDESAHLSSDYRPTARQLWKPPVGTLELGILGAQNLLPMKTKGGRGSTDSYCVAKYGQKWVRTRTVTDSFNPRWNEQYTWPVYDPCTVLTVGVFDNWQIFNAGGDKEKANPDHRIGKVRIRISTLESNKVYTNSYPLMVLLPSGVKKMGEIELAVRFSSVSLVDVLQVYTQPLLPRMHYLYPLGLMQQDFLRTTAMKIVAARLSMSEPPLKREVIEYMLDTDSSMWSMRRSKANWLRIKAVLSGVMGMAYWMQDICRWKNSVTTVLVHMLYMILMWYPELIVPTVLFYVSVVGWWGYRYRPRIPPHMDVVLSHADAVDEDELDEEFDTIPSTKPHHIVRARYDRLRTLAARIQNVLGDVATQGERAHALLSWRDPRATAIFVVMCLSVSLVLYVVPFRVVALFVGFYLLRHPRFRKPMPPASVNFFRRLPSLSDRLL